MKRIIIVTAAAAVLAGCGSISASRTDCGYIVTHPVTATCTGHPAGP